MVRRSLPVAFVVLLLGAVLGCEKDPAPPPVTVCTKPAEQCKLPDGPLGICNTVACAPGATPPCLRCTSQH